jgi:hypothetical protein
MQFCVTRVILRDLAALVPQIFHSLHKITHFLTGYINSYCMLVSKVKALNNNKFDYFWYFHCGNENLKLGNPNMYFFPTFFYVFLKTRPFNNFLST